MGSRISLCMIVRDEAENLPAFLDGVRGVWDELVAVDTGSNDATRELLVAAGAKVLRRPWDDDFAAARNFGLERAAGDWLLVLDADERVGPDLAAEIRHVAGDVSCGAASLLVVDRLPHGHVRRSRLLRMFRNDGTVRYRHAIHEDVFEEVVAFLARSGLQRADLEAPLLHLGYERERATAKDKKERDVRILRAALARDPSDLYLRFKLMEQARFWRDRALWASAAAETAAAVERDGAALRSAYFAGELLALMVDGLHAEAGAALGCLESFASRIPPSAAYDLRRGELREKIGDTAGARAAFLRCLSLQGVTGNEQLATVRPRLGLARLALASGDLDGAAREGQIALSHAPLDPEALLLLATLRLACGGPAALALFAEKCLAASGDHPEIHAAVLEAACLAGDSASPRRFLP
jgi:tetratricopeptide (TPR) repeat protein